MFSPILMLIPCWFLSLLLGFGQRKEKKKTGNVWYMLFQEQNLEKYMLSIWPKAASRPDGGYIDHICPDSCAQQFYQWSFPICIKISIKMNTIMWRKSLVCSVQIIIITFRTRSHSATVAQWLACLLISPVMAILQLSLTSWKKIIWDSVEFFAFCR